ncbi:hypothetical protein GQ602_004488 [Ophiocordyceps camponoti-floridani]|uniref:Uncharacterized protein n=1 Tax=Ophiocordyceps camponoti-floridani TaxID=2030778 RepID=A0A8H4VDK8_9HYPO|nr:hypothetical protein GQ602_004488 [Ophiocordyceps camponoti-floridani]
MASFSRGLGLCWRSLFRPQFAFPRPGQGPASAIRFFTSSLNRPLASKPDGRAVVAQALQSTSRYAFLTKLAAKTTPTVLYESPSHFWFFFTCWSAGLTLVGWSVFTAPVVLDQPEGVPEWTKQVYIVSYILLCAIGFWLMAKTHNVVSSIRLLPSTAVSTSGASPIATAAAKLQLEVTVKRMLPLFPHRVIKTGIDKVTLKTRPSRSLEELSEPKRLQKERLETKRRAELRKFDMDHLLTMPFRRIGRGFVNMFNGTKSAWTGSGFGTITVNGKRHQLDVMGGFSHDNFRTLERIVNAGVRKS